MTPLSEELDGHGLVRWINSSEEAYNKWLTNLCLAERNGWKYYSALATSGAVPGWLVPEVRRMAGQELKHFGIATGLARERGIILPNLVEPNHALSLERVDLDENRAVMRFWAILKHGGPLEAKKIARQFLADEEYHTGVTAKLVEACGALTYGQLL
jgi:hypothetical protein